MYLSSLPNDCCLCWLFILLISKTSCWMVPVLLAMHDWFHQTFLNLDHWSYLIHPKWPLYRVVLFFSHFLMLGDVCLHDTFSNHLYYFQAKTRVLVASKSFELWGNRCIFEFGRENLAVQWAAFVGFTHLLVKDTLIQLDSAFETALS